jgi:uncharacterized membrane protein
MKLSAKKYLKAIIATIIYVAAMLVSYYIASKLLNQPFTEGGCALVLVIGQLITGFLKEENQQ